MKDVIFKAFGSILAVVGIAVLVSSFTGSITGFAIASTVGGQVVGSILGLGFVIGGILLITKAKTEEHRIIDKMQKGSS